MTQTNFKDNLILFLESSYTIEQPYVIEDREFEFYGHFNQRNAKFLASKKLEYYAFSTFDHLFFKYVPTVSKDFLKDLYALTEDIVDVYSKVDDEHMETSITYVIQTDEPISPEIETFVKKKMNFIKNHSFGLQGWSKLKLIILVPTSQEVYVNKFGNRDKESFQKILAKISKF